MVSATRAAVRERLEAILAAEWEWDAEEEARQVDCETCGETIWLDTERNPQCLDCWKVDAILALLDDSESRTIENYCTTCGGSPHPSGKVCICGGVGTLLAEIQGLREALYDSVSGERVGYTWVTMGGRQFCAHPMNAPDYARPVFLHPDTEQEPR